MKIVHVADTMEVGGAEMIVTQLCRWQRERGHDPSVHCLYRLGPLGEDLRREGFEVVLHDPGHGGRARSFYRETRRRKPDIVHCHNATATIISAIPARTAGAKVVVSTRHGVVSPPYSLRRELKFSLASRWCDWIVAVCEQAARNLAGAPFAARGKIVRIYNAVTPPTSAVSPKPKHGFTLLHVARLNSAKDQPTLLRAFALAKAQVSDLQLWMVGGGELHSSMVRLAREIGVKDDVTFFGEQADVASFLTSADLFVLSSISEGVPISLLEALASGLPAVVTEVGGMGEIARLSKATVTVPPSNPEALAAAIVKVATERGDLPALGNLARQTYLLNFTLDRMASEYIALYDTRYRPHLAGALS